MKFKAIISVGPRKYTVFLPTNTGISNAHLALSYVRNTLLNGGIFVLSDNEAIEINCLDKYEALRIVEYIDAPQPPAVEPLKDDYATDVNKEYGLTTIADFSYLGQGMDVSILTYYAKNHIVLMPSVINGSHAYGYMSEKNVVEFMHKIAKTRLQLTPDAYTVLLYPGPLVDMEDGIEYLRDWVRSREQDIYIPKVKNAKAFHGWTEKGN